MSVTLSHHGDHYYIQNLGWVNLLKLAYEYGWEPAGTELLLADVVYVNGKVDYEATERFNAPRKDYDWDGSYFGSDFQFVTDEDAANIADALERAIDDIPNQQAYTRRDIRGDRIYSMSPKAYFSGADKQRVETFIEFCRGGGFMID